MANSSRANLVSILLQRNDSSVDWGFDLALDGIHNQMIVKGVRDGTLSSWSMTSGDAVLKVGGRSTKAMSVEKARHIIEQSGNAVEIIIKKRPQTASWSPAGNSTPAFSPSKFTPSAQNTSWKPFETPQAANSEQNDVIQGSVKVDSSGGYVHTFGAPKHTPTPQTPSFASPWQHQQSPSYQGATSNSSSPRYTQEIIIPSQNSAENRIRTPARQVSQQSNDGHHSPVVSSPVYFQPQKNGFDNRSNASSAIAQNTQRHDPSHQAHRQDSVPYQTFRQNSFPKQGENSASHEPNSWSHSETPQQLPNAFIRQGPKTPNSQTTPIQGGLFGSRNSSNSTTFKQEPIASSSATPAYQRQPSSTVNYQPSPKPFTPPSQSPSNQSQQSGSPFCYGGPANQSQQPASGSPFSYGVPPKQSQQSGSPFSQGVSYNQSQQSGSPFSYGVPSNQSQQSGSPISYGAPSNQSQQSGLPISYGGPPNQSQQSGSPFNYGAPSNQSQQCGSSVSYGGPGSLMRQQSCNRSDDFLPAPPPLSPSAVSGWSTDLPTPPPPPSPASMVPPPPPPPALMASLPPPPPPMPPATTGSQDVPAWRKQIKATKEAKAAAGVPSVPPGTPGSAGPEIPGALAGAMKKDKKPFTYLPGGLDLSEIRSPKMQRRIMANQQEAPPPPSCTGQQVLLQPLDSHMDRLNLADSPQQGMGQPQQQQGRPGTDDPKHYGQSRSFRVLQMMTGDDQTDSAIPAQSGVAREPEQESRFTGLRRPDNPIPSRAFHALQKMTGGQDESPQLTPGRYQNEDSQQQQLEEGPADIRYRGGYIPGKSFKMLQDMTGMNEEGAPTGTVVPSVLQQKRQQQLKPNLHLNINSGTPQPRQFIQPSVPASQQQAEEAPKMYAGGRIPSQSFRILQAMTGENSGEHGTDM